jgi:hypothetical protein
MSNDIMKPHEIVSFFRKAANADPRSQVVVRFKDNSTTQGLPMYDSGHGCNGRCLGLDVGKNHPGHDKWFAAAQQLDEYDEPEFWPDEIAYHVAFADAAPTGDAL